MKQILLVTIMALLVLTVVIPATKIVVLPRADATSAWLCVTVVCGGGSWNDNPDSGYDNNENNDDN